MVRKKKDLASPKLAHAWRMNEILNVKVYLRRREQERHVIKVAN